MGNVIGFQFICLVAWTINATFISPIGFSIGLVAMLLSTNDWNMSWEATYTKANLWITALTYWFESGYSYYLFRTNFNEAIFYYDEVLQEKHEEIIQFGEPEEEGDDITDDLLDNDVTIEADDELDFDE